MIDRWNVVQSLQCKYDARTHLSSLEWHDLRVVRRTDDCVIACDRLTVSCLTKELLAVSACVSEVLPRLPRLAVVLRPLEREHSRTWRVGHLDEDVRHVKLLQRTVRQHASASPVRYGFAAKPNIPTRPDTTRPDLRVYPLPVRRANFFLTLRVRPKHTQRARAAACANPNLNLNPVP